MNYLMLNKDDITEVCGVISKAEVKKELALTEHQFWLFVYLGKIFREKYILVEEEFKKVIGNRIEKQVEVTYAYQELKDIPEQYQDKFAERKKPWGTGQAILCCKEVVDSPFLVINADDYYGKEAFVKLHDFLVGYVPEKANQFCMAGFILKNTLSENGAVTRGICETNEEGYLTAVHETSNIVKTPEGAAVDNDGQLTSINAESYASMNMWGLTPEFMQTLEDGFKEFFANMGDKDILKAEYLLPIYIDELLQAGKVSVKVLDTNDKWFGVTYALLCGNFRVCMRK